MRNTVSLGILLLLGGCSLGGKAPPFLLSLSPTVSPAANQGQAVSNATALAISVPLAPQAITATRVPVAQGGAAIAYVKDAVWVEPPAKLFQRLLAETVRAKTGRLVIEPRQTGAPPGTILSGQLLHFEIAEGTSEAIVVYEAMLSGPGGAMQARRFEARSPVSKIEAAAAGVALNRAANQVAGDVSDWLIK
jgi:cholesterol transport system auxiliary component